MKPSSLITLLVIIIGVLFFFSWGYAKRGTTGPVGAVNIAPTESGSGTLAASETFYDFGTISMKNGNVTKDFTITNTAAEAVTMKNITTSCMCTSALIVAADGTTKGPFGMAGHGGTVPPANETVPAGESRTIRVVFDPNAHGPAGVGRIERVVTITDSSGGTTQLDIKAVVTP